MFSNKKPDFYTCVNSGYYFVIVMVACNSVFSDAINTLSKSKISEKDYMATLIFLASLYISVGAALFNHKINIMNQQDVLPTTRVNSEISLDNVTDYASMDSERGSVGNSRYLLRPNNILSLYDMYILSCVAGSSFCFGVFPSLFMCHNFDLESHAKGLSSGLICTASIFGVAYSVASVRNAKSVLLG